jgi:hypothetical protein
MVIIMARHISPPISELKSLRTPLTEGEWRVFHFFNNHLPKAWEIYIQPNMNGLEPDFVLLNPDVGIAVFEVKDWHLDNANFRYRVESDFKGNPILVAGTGAKREGANPVTKARLYREEIFNLYCPRLGEKAGNKGFSAVSAGVIFTNSMGDKARSLFHRWLKEEDLEGQYFRVSGCDDLDSGELRRVFPEGIRANSYVMKADLASDFRSWLQEPDTRREQRHPIILNERQITLVTSRTDGGYRRVKGPAGSGKSIVVAARAATLALQNKDVLVLCFNMTLINYLRDLCSRWRRDLRRREVVDKVTWIHFHQWCKRVCFEAGAEDEYREFWKNTLGAKGEEGDENDPDNVCVDDSVFDYGLSSLVDRVIEQQGANLKKYDAILVDEGQDFLPDWWNVLRKVCKPGGEMLLVADASQDIYNNARKWTDGVMKGAGFFGDWSKLQGSYRLPTSFIPLLQRFAKDFLPADNVDIPASTQETFLGALEGPCHLRWVDASGVDESRQACVEEILKLAISSPGKTIPIADITALVSSNDDGEWLVEKLEALNIRTIHTFSKDKSAARRKKANFYKGDARVKVTTIHCFKGIESRAMVICLRKGGSSDMALAYTAMTRLKRSEDANYGSYLTVVSSHPELSEFGKTWPARLISSNPKDCAGIEALSQEKVMSEEQLDKVIEEMFRDRSFEESKDNFDDVNFDFGRGE